MKKILILLVIVLVSITNFILISTTPPDNYGSFTLQPGETYKVGSDIELGNYLVNTSEEEVIFSLTYENKEKSELTKYNNESFIVDPSIIQIEVDKKTTLNKRY